MPLSPTKHIYKFVPLGALALKPRCETSSPVLAILEVAPSGNPIQFVLFLNQQMEEQ